MIWKSLNTSTRLPAIMLRIRYTLTQASRKYLPSLSSLGTYCCRNRRVFLSSSLQPNEAGASAGSAGNPRRRKRHRFNLNTDEVPSFQDFQQNFQIRSLFRKFLRLVGPTKSANGSQTDRIDPSESSRSSFYELRLQVRREFKAIPKTADRWDVKRAISDGNKRYKELTAMFMSVPRGRTRQTTEDSTNPSNLPLKVEGATNPSWPWETTESFQQRSPPKRFPSKLDKP